MPKGEKHINYASLFRVKIIMKSIGRGKGWAKGWKIIQQQEKKKDFKYKSINFSKFRNRTLIIYTDFKSS